MQKMQFGIELRCQFAGVFRGGGRIVAEVGRQQNFLKSDRLVSPVLVLYSIGFVKSRCPKPFLKSSLATKTYKTTCAFRLFPIGYCAHPAATNLCG